MDAKINKYVITNILKSGTMGSLINRITGSRLLISSLPSSASRTYDKSLDKSRESTSVLKVLISKDSHLVFSISEIKFYF